MSRFQKFLNQLAVVLEFTQLKPDKHGACLIIMKANNVPLLFEFDDQLVPNSILVSCPVTSIQYGYENVALTACLKRNELIEETLSKKPDEEQIYLHRRIHPGILSEDLKPIVDHFIETVLASKQELETLQRPMAKEG